METFRLFKEAVPAAELALWLQDRDIEARVVDTSPYFDPSFANNAFTKVYAVKIPGTEFIRANGLLTEYYRLQLDKVPQDYYLFSFTDDELRDILAKPDQWGELDYAFAGELLRRRGKGVTGEEMTSLKAHRLEELKLPERDGRNMIRWGYALCIVSGLIGSLIGWYLAYAQKTLPDGSRVPSYAAGSRKHGRIIFWLGAGITTLVFAVRIYLSYRR